MIDFDALVIGPGQSVFGLSVVFRPPGAAAFSGRGVFTSTPMDIEMQGSTTFSDNRTTLNVRLSEIAKAAAAVSSPTVPERGWIVDIAAQIGHPIAKSYFVADIDTDGQGAADLPLKNLEPGA